MSKIRPTQASHISRLPCLFFFVLFVFDFFYLHRLRHGSRHPIFGVRPVPRQRQMSQVHDDTSFLTRPCVQTNIFTHQILVLLTYFLACL